MNKNNPIILVDMDGVLADYESEFLRQYREKFPTHFYIPTEKRKVFYIHDEYPDELSEDIRSIYSAPGFFRSLPLINGAKEAIFEMDAIGYSVFICTSPVNRYENCVTEKYLWVARHFGHEWTKKIIMTKDKTLIHGDILIDDKPHHTGITTPSWEHILYDAPYNREITGKRRLTWMNWKESISFKVIK